MTVARLHELYLKSIIDSLLKKFSFKNKMEVPSIKKIVVSIFAKEAVVDSKVLDKIYDDLFVITGQKPLILKAKKSIAAFKLREGMRVGYKVTLRKKMMYEFLDRLVNIALPRSRDFKGFNKSQFDGKGNFSLGVKEQIIFPEIDYNKIDKVRGMGITIVTSTDDNDEAKFLLESFNIPFVN